MNTSDRQLFRFDHSYASLPSGFYSSARPAVPPHPKAVLINERLCEALGLDPNAVSRDRWAEYLSGKTMIPGSLPLAQAYAGHQFGGFTMLGDGRAILLGEHLDNNNQRWDIQLKGSGRTVFSRRGDGKATLYSMLREYLISEAMHALGIPTSRSLAVVSTGETVHREFAHPGAVLTRVATSHIRVGTFEYAARFLKKEDLRALLDYTVARHYPEYDGIENKALYLIRQLIVKQSQLIASWMSVGFIHGVMNTDNMSVAGITFDYGPCAFMDAYDPDTVFSSIDTQGRYAYGNQPYIAHWNIAVLAGALLPLIDEVQEEAKSLAQSALNEFEKEFRGQWQLALSRKLALDPTHTESWALCLELLEWMHTQKADFTNTFLYLQGLEVEPHEVPVSPVLEQWIQRWHAQLLRTGTGLADARESMGKYNPLIIPRNHQVEHALEMAWMYDNYEPFDTLLRELQTPYGRSDSKIPYMRVPAKVDASYRTFCGT